jgi:hypothetical protein
VGVVILDQRLWAYQWVPGVDVGQWDQGGRCGHGRDQCIIICSCVTGVVTWCIITGCGHRLDQRVRS